MDVYAFIYIDVVCNINHNLNLILYFVGVFMKSYLSIALFLLLGISLSPVFAQDQNCSYVAPRETSFNQNIFSASIPLCGLPDVELSGDSYHFAPEIHDIEQRKQELKWLINNAYISLHDVSDKQEKADLKSAISSWKKEILTLNYKMIMTYKDKYFGKIIGK